MNNQPATLSMRSRNKVFFPEKKVFQENQQTNSSSYFPRQTSIRFGKEEGEEEDQYSKLLKIKGWPSREEKEEEKKLCFKKILYAKYEKFDCVYVRSKSVSTRTQVQRSRFD